MGVAMLALTVTSYGVNSFLVSSGNWFYMVL